MEISVGQIARERVLAELLAERCAMIDAMHAEILALRSEIQAIKKVKEIDLGED